MTKTPWKESRASTAKGTPRRGVATLSKFQVPPRFWFPTLCSVANTVDCVKFESAFIKLFPLVPAPVWQDHKQIWRFEDSKVGSVFSTSVVFIFSWTEASASKSMTWPPRTTSPGEPWPRTCKVSSPSSSKASAITWVASMSGVIRFTLTPSLSPASNTSSCWTEASAIKISWTSMAVEDLSEFDALSELFWWFIIDFQECTKVI